MPLAFLLTAVLLLISSTTSPAQDHPTAKVKEGTTLTVGAQQIPLAAGAAVKVLSLHGDKAVVRFDAADGSPVITEIDAANLEMQTAAPPPPAAAPAPAPAAVPEVAAVTNAPPLTTATLTAVIKNDAPIPLLKDVPPMLSSGTLVSGWQTVKFPELPMPAILPAWPSYVPKAADENFIVYIPKNFDPAKTYGFIGWTDAADGRAPKNFEKIFDDYGLICVMADKAGNRADTSRRLALLPCALLEISKFVKIDPARHFLGGFSGGARLSCIAAFCYPDEFNGIVTWCGAHFYRDVPQVGRDGYVWYGYPREFKAEPPTTEQVFKTRDNVRFALLTGTKDSNLNPIQSNAAGMKAEKFHVKVIVQPDMGHTLGSDATMREGLDYLIKGGDDADSRTDSGN